MPALTDEVSRLPANRTVDEVVDRLTSIEAALDGFYAPGAVSPAARRDRPPPIDGVACFNGMYLQVTEAVRAALGRFENRAFIERLDVLFAEFYFQAYAAAAAGAWLSKAWAPLFKRREERHVLALQFAIAGMNAHINNDLAHALVLTWNELGVDPGGDTPERRDYERVNDILEHVETEIKGPLADDFIAGVDSVFGTADDFLALWSIRRARDEAWERAELMRALPTRELDGLFDRFVGFAGNLLLHPSVLRL